MVFLAQRNIPSLAQCLAKSSYLGPPQELDGAREKGSECCVMETWDAGGNPEGEVRSATVLYRSVCIRY